MKFGVGVIGATGFIGTPYRSEIRAARARPELLHCVPGGANCFRRGPGGQRRACHRRLATGDRPSGGQPCRRRHSRRVALRAGHGLRPKTQAHVLREADRDQRLASAGDVAGLPRIRPGAFRAVLDAVRAGVCPRARLVAAGLVGEIQAVIYRWHNPRPAGMPFTWRDDAALSAAGSIADVGSHAYDTIRWILGQEATRVLTHAIVLGPAKPDIGAVNLDEALRFGESAAGSQQPAARRKGTVPDYAAISIQFASGAVGVMVLSHATYMRKGLAPELELHGTEASLGIDRLSGGLSLARPGQVGAPFETVPDPGFGNRFARHVFPAMRARAAGAGLDQPGLDDGWRAQRFTDAAVLSARRGGWGRSGRAGRSRRSAKGPTIANMSEGSAKLMPEVRPLSITGRYLVLITAFVGWLCAGTLLSITTLAMRPAAIDLLSRAKPLDGASPPRFRKGKSRGGSRGSRAPSCSAPRPAGWGSGGWATGSAGPRRWPSASLVTRSFRASPILPAARSSCSSSGFWPARASAACGPTAWPWFRKHGRACRGRWSPASSARRPTLASFLLATLATREGITPDNWRWVMLVRRPRRLCWACSVLVAVPESPRWLAARGADTGTGKRAGLHRRSFPAAVSGGHRWSGLGWPRSR